MTHEYMPIFVTFQLDPSSGYLFEAAEREASQRGIARSVLLRSTFACAFTSEVWKRVVEDQRRLPVAALYSAARKHVYWIDSERDGAAQIREGLLYLESNRKAGYDV